MDNIVIVGAGLSGRGFLNRLLSLSDKKVTFIDSNEALVTALQKQTSYKIRFGTKRDEILINNYRAFHNTNSRAIQAMAEADLMMVCVGADHVKEVVEPIQSSLLVREKGTLDIIVAENGIHPSKPLLCLKEDRRVQIAEAIIFCTTSKGNGELEILSENLDYFPYDVDALKHTLKFHGFVEEYRLNELLQRKIYTYNCISASVAYLGYIRRYEGYAEAANDPYIDAKIQKIADALNEGIVKEYGITWQTQKTFSRMAIKKFKDVHIIDTIERNVRAVNRKLGASERIIAPLLMLKKYDLYSEQLLEVAACAIYYGLETNTLLHKVDPINEYFSELPSAWRERIAIHLMYLKKKE